MRSRIKMSKMYSPEQEATRRPAHKSQNKRKATEAWFEGEPAETALYVFPALKIGRVDSSEEREADEMAHRVVGNGAPERMPQRVAGQSEGGGLAVSPAIADRIQARSGQGESLPAADREFFEPRFGRGFEDVVIHRDAEANDLARSLNAKAFTVRSDIYFGSGQYSQDEDGRRLLAHELTHTVQQGAAKTVQRQIRPEGKEAGVDLKKVQSEVERIILGHRDNPSEMVRLLIARTITVSAEYAHLAFLEVAVLADKYPELAGALNVVLRAMGQNMAGAVDLSPETMTWFDLFNIWLFELGDFDEIRFGDHAATTSDLKKQEGITQARNQAHERIQRGDLSTLPFSWTYDQAAFYQGIKNRNLATSFLGSFGGTVSILAHGTGEYILIFRIENTTGRASGTRLRQAEVPGAEGGKGVHLPIILDKDRGKGIPLGGTLRQVWTWSEIVRIEKRP